MPSATSNTLQKRNNVHTAAPKGVNLTNEGDLVASPLPAKAQPAAKEAHAPGLLERNERITVAVLLLVSIATRFYRLDKPNGVVFDEFHFGRFTNQYMRGEYLFDIHPPFAKLVLLAVAKLVGYNPDDCAYNNIHDQYGEHCKFLWLRATAAAFGALTVLPLYGILIFWCAAALWAAQSWWARWNTHWAAVDRFERIAGQAYTMMEAVGAGGPDVAGVVEPDAVAAKRAAYTQAVDAIRLDNNVFRIPARICWAVVIGICCANCVSVKFTGLATPGAIAVESFFAFFFLHRAVPMPDLLLIAAVTIATFISYYWVHFSILTNAGDGDAFMSQEFQQTLKGNPSYDPQASWPPFLQLVLDLNREMVAASARIEQRHAWESVWWEWPVNARGVLYYSQATAHTYTETVYLLGNPLAIWSLLAFLCTGILSVIFYARYRTDALLEWGFRRPLKFYFSTATFCVLVYILNLAPYVAVKRSCFIYHYMPALMYGEILAGLVFDQMVPVKWRSLACNIITIAVVISFLFYAPWVYAFAMTPEGHERRRWLPRWD